MDLTTNGDFTPYNPNTVNIRCPACRHIGAFGGVGQPDVSTAILETKVDGRRGVVGTRKFGLRLCPNHQCQSVIFVVQEGKDVFALPPEVLDFDGTNLPPDILSSLEEAIRCHAATCYRAAALMVRRTLEELCDDKNAVGNNLKARIVALSAVAIVPSELLAAADELRILGNNAAHIEAKDYDQIGKEESELAIELAKELLKAVYQYTSLVARLTALKKPPA